ncbi:MAG: hypothetical protein Q8Q31_03995 [Nanoarchaeota archaeon]|nr:hypothetical protein [Nanoarchaeota archaeon]
MVEDGSRAGFYLAAIGGYVNLIAMAGLIVRIILIALESLELESPDYFTYFVHIGAMLYIGILGVWMLAAAYKMRYSHSLYSGAKTSLILGILSLNIFAIFGGIFGLNDFKSLAVDLARERITSDDLKLNPNF